VIQDTGKKIVGKKIRSISYFFAHDFLARVFFLAPTIFLRVCKFLDEISTPCGLEMEVRGIAQRLSGP
jgi:hypothetical protein